MRIVPVFFWTDILIYLLLLSIVIAILWGKRREDWQTSWHLIAKRRLGMIAFVCLIAYSLVGLLDSIHFRPVYAQPADTNRFSSGQVISALDALLWPLGQQREKTYSAPFSIYLSTKATTVQHGKLITYYPRLTYAGRYLQNASQVPGDIAKKSAMALAIGLAISAICVFMLCYRFAKKSDCSISQAFKEMLSKKTSVAWREVILTMIIIILLGSWMKILSQDYHVFGTDKIGSDILYETIKSIRTGLVIGTLTTLIVLPFAVLFGTLAGYFGGWRDDIIQYIYTTLSSVPAVLLISAAVLSLQIFIANHATLFPSLESRADARLLALCVILGITSWTSLCRLLRAETLKLREMDYVKAAIALGVSHLKIIWRHIVPNVLHIILITIVLDFSALVLAEAVLSYVGVGVDPITASWGNMINSARLDLAREPVVWWPLFAAFIFMFILVLSANLFSDAVRDAFDPRLRHES